MNNEISLLQLILEASLVVQAVMLLLVLMSFASWSTIIRKRIQLSRARVQAQAFEERFWSGIDLASLYNEISNNRQAPSGLELIFHSGFEEFLRLRNQSLNDASVVVQSMQRAMRAALSREGDDLESGLAFLATVASSSPYFGLFGTVWGIMNAFLALQGAQQATLTEVAPGIAEALVATAIGLFAAIPAVIAYNYCLADVERTMARYESFSEEFSNILQRQTWQLFQRRNS